MPITKATEHTDIAGCLYTSSHTEASSKPKPDVTFSDFPFGGQTCNDTVPSVIKVSTQGSRILHTRRTPAHTGDDIKGRNKGGRKVKTGTGLLRSKKKGQS